MKVTDTNSATVTVRGEEWKWRRERIATAVLAGFAGLTGGDPDEIARIAVIWADALIAELDKP